MRIIGGKLKRRLLKFPRSKKTRPVTDRSKETIFNILGDTVTNSSVLDLFAGSGSLGIESLSRGVKQVYFVEKDFHVCRVIRNNLQNLEAEKSCKVFHLPAPGAIAMFARKHLIFDLIFIDPPYHHGWIKKILHLLDRFDIVQKFGKLVVGRSRHESLPEDLVHFKLEREVEIGQSFLDFLVKREGLDLEQKQC